MLRSATRREDWVLLRDTSPDGWGPPSPTAAPSAPPLTRQPSIRRLPARSRTVDFTDFTSRRRSSGREGNNSVVPGPEPEADDSASSTTTTATLSSRLSPNTTWVPPRRFFPTRRPELPWSPESTSSSTGTGSGMGSSTGAAPTPSGRSSPAPSTATTTTTTTTQAEGRSPRTFLSWLPSSALLSLPPPPPADLRGSRTIPRLRRGGVRPPESLLGHDLAMLRTESPEPMPGSNGGTTAAGASAGMEGDVPSLSNASTVSSETVLAPVDTPRAESPAPAD
jgi:hypothetical protein